jgi:hypothetical protein
MLKYKDNYIFKFERDYSNKVYNRDDNYIACRNKGKIWRYNDDTLVFESPYKIRLKKVDPKTEEVIYDYTSLVLEIENTDAEILIKFKEENLDKLEKIFKVRKKKKISEQTKEILSQRMKNIRIKVQ